MTLERNFPDFQNLGQESGPHEAAKDTPNTKVRSKWELVSESLSKPSDLIDAAELPVMMSAAELAAMFPSETQSRDTFAPEGVMEAPDPSRATDGISRPVDSPTELIRAAELPAVSAADLAALFSSETQSQDTFAPNGVTETSASRDGLEETESSAVTPSNLIDATQLPSISAADLAALFPTETRAQDTLVPEAVAADSTAGTLEETESSPLAQEELIHAAELPSVSPKEVEALFSSGAKAAGPERRRRRRVRISMPVRLRGVDATVFGAGEITTTADVSRIGFLFHTASASYSLGMTLAVTFPYSAAPDAIQKEQQARVVRILHVAYGERAVAVALDEGNEDLVNSGGRKLLQATPQTQTAASYAPEPELDKPLVLALHEDHNERDLVTSYLSGEGYRVIAVGTVDEAIQVLDRNTPALVISDIEGNHMPGYELCSHVKATPRLNKVPVMLMTNAAYPSDYASAHTVGAVVCMAKPYRPERLGNVVRLLAPPQKSETAKPRPRAQNAETPSTSFYDRGRASQTRPRRNTQ